jgi:AcrR family transcriptional regulator
VNDRTQTARQDLLGAFADLALSRNYLDFGVGLIVRRAKVARSTFYYHFRAKDDLLVENLAPFLSLLARLPLELEPPPALLGWTEHIWEHRARARRMLDGPTGRRIAEALTDALRTALSADPARGHRTPLLADQIAGASLSLLRAWTAAGAGATAADVAKMLWSGARTLAGESGGHGNALP